MSQVSPTTAELVGKMANRLHHLSLRYVGALFESAQGKPVGLIPQGHPGLREMRDLIDLILFTRAEINCLTKLLCDAGLIDAEKFAVQMADEYHWLATEKANFLSVSVEDYGLVFKTGGKTNGQTNGQTPTA